MRTREDNFVSIAAEIPIPPTSAVFNAANGPRFLWDAPDEPTVIATGAAASINVDGPTRFSRVRESAASVMTALDSGSLPKKARPRFLGGFSFQPTPPETPDNSAIWDDFHDAQFFLPRVQLVIDDDSAWLTITDTVENGASPGLERQLAAKRNQIQSASEQSPDRHSTSQTVNLTPTRDSWNDLIRDTTAYISESELQKVVLAQKHHVRVDRSIAVSPLLLRLNEAYPNCTRFLFAPDCDTHIGDDAHASFLGATPERLIRLEGGHFSTVALAGTTPRGSTTTEDEALADRLMESGKNNHEHELVVRSITEELRSLSTSLTIGQQHVKKMSNLQHLSTLISGDCAPDMHVLQLVEALHPTPAVGGLPRTDALEYITKHEQFDRGLYAGPVGWFDGNGDGSFAVGIRSALILGLDVHFFAGVGIVHESNPAAEWREATLKNRSILKEIVNERCGR